MTDPGGRNNHGKYEPHLNFAMVLTLLENTMSDDGRKDEIECITLGEAFVKYNTAHPLLLHSARTE